MFGKKYNQNKKLYRCLYTEKKISGEQSIFRNWITTIIYAKLKTSNPKTKLSLNSRKVADRMDSYQRQNIQTVLIKWGCVTH